MYVNPFIKGTFPETHPTWTYFQASLSCNISSHIIFGKSICLSYLTSHLYYLASYLNPHVGWWIPFFICENRTTSMAAAVALMWRWAFSPPLAHRESCVGDGHEVHRWEKEVGLVIILSMSGVLYWVYNGLIVFTSRVNALVYLVKLQSYYIYIIICMYNIYLWVELAIVLGIIMVNSPPQVGKFCPPYWWKSHQLPTPTATPSMKHIWGL